MQHWNRDNLIECERDHGLKKYKVEHMGHHDPPEQFEKAFALIVQGHNSMGHTEYIQMIKKTYLVI